MLYEIASELLFLLSSIFVCIFTYLWARKTEECKELREQLRRSCYLFTLAFLNDLHNVDPTQVREYVEFYGVEIMEGSFDRWFVVCVQKKSGFDQNKVLLFLSQIEEWLEDPTLKPSWRDKLQILKRKLKE